MFPQASLFSGPLSLFFPARVLLLATLALAWLSPAQAYPDFTVTGASRVVNGHFQQSGNHGIAQAWTLSGGWQQASLSTPATHGPGQTQRIHLSGGNATFSQNVSLQAHQDYLFTAWVRSEERVVVRLGQLSLSYNDPGNWQRLTGLLAGSSATSVNLQFQLGGLGSLTKLVEIEGVELLPVNRPTQLPERPNLGPTSLVSNGQAAAVIVYPSGYSVYHDHALAIQAAITAATGVTLPIATDLEATENDAPSLTGFHRSQHLILLGRLGINRALWPSYNRYLCAVDGYYPGGNGYVVRTAVNVFANGKNHIVLGGSNEAGTARAVDAFLDILNNQSVSPGELTLPWLLEVELGGACLTAFQNDNARWTANPFDSALPPREPGYGTVRRWYHNAMAWYWSGWPAYAHRAQTELQQVLSDSAYTHHYIAEFMVRTHNMVAHTGLHGPAEGADMDALILKNFLDYMTPAGDLTWMTTFAPPYANSVTNRHSIAPWMADLQLADHLHQHFSLNGHLADLVRFRQEEKSRFMEHLVQERWGPSLPGAPYSDAHEEIVLSLFRFALEHEHHGFFTSGNAARALSIDRISHRSGRLIDPGGGYDHHLMLGILAHYHRDGDYRALLDRLPVVHHETGPFMGRYVNGVHRYQPGDELPPGSHTRFEGLRLPPLMPNDLASLTRLQRGPYLLPDGFNPGQAFDIAAMRAGFAIDDDYMALAGMAMSRPAGTFHSLVSRDMEWIRSGSADTYFEQNGLLIQRSDVWQPATPSWAGAARLDWASNPTEALGGVALTLEPFTGTCWQRQVLRLGSGIFVVRDTVTALEAGQYDIAVNWRLTGSPSWNGHRLDLLTNRGRLAVTPLGAAFQTSETIGDFRDGLIEDYRFYHSANLLLSLGESVTSTTVLQAYRTGQDILLDATLEGPDLLHLTPMTGNGNPLRVFWNNQMIPGLSSDASLFIITDNYTMVLNATFLTVHGTPVFQSATARSFILNQTDGHIVVEDPEQAKDWSLAANAAGMLDHLDTLLDLAASSNGGGLPPSGSIPPLVAHDHTSLWETSWSYDGLHRPRRILPVTSLGNNIVDLGEVVDLHEIRAATQPSGAWVPLALPATIETALPLPAGGPPPADSPAWQPVNEPRQWRPGVQTGNYGEGVPTGESYQIVRPGNRPARYVRASGSTTFSYYRSDKTGAREPLRLETVTLSPEEDSGLFVASDVPTVWPRNHRLEDASMAVLDAGGVERFQADIPGNSQGLRVLKNDLNTDARILLATWDAQIHLINLQGQWEEHYDLYALHQEFQNTYGSPDTRHPAGGYTTPYGIGLWRPDASGRHKLVIPRYGGVSFLDEAGNLEGLLTVGGYASSAILPYGVDFKNNGTEEQLILERYRVVHLSGEAIPYVSDPQGAAYFPQVYAHQNINQGDSTSSLTGARVLVFETLPWGPSPRYVAIVRETFLGIYDGRDRKWVFSWHPPTPLRSAAITRAHSDRLRIVATSADNQLWELDWLGVLDTLHDFRTRPFADSVRRMHGNPALTDAALLPGRHGLYLLPGSGELIRLASGSFHDSVFLPGQTHESISVVATTREGEVLRLDRLPGAPVLPAPSRDWEGSGFFGFNLILDAGRAITMNTSHAHLEAVRFQATDNLPADRVSFYLNSVTGNPGLRVSLREDNGTGDPRGQWLVDIGVGSPVAGWNSVTLPPGLLLEKGKTYHLIFYLTQATANDHLSLRAATTASPLSDFLTENSPDPSYSRRFSHDGGNTWTTSDHVAGSVAYVFENTATQQSMGQPYVFPQSRNFGQTRWMGQRFVYTGTEAAFMNAVTLRVGLVAGRDPADDVRLHIVRASDNALLHSATFLRKEEATEQAVNHRTRLAWNQRPILEPDVTYILAVESIGSTGEDYRLAGLNWMYALGDNRVDFQGTAASAVAGNSASGIPGFHSLNTATVFYDFFFGLETTPVNPGPRFQIPVAVTTHPAFALRFPGRLEHTYQVQYSPDLVHWYDDGTPLSGANGLLQHFTPEQDAAFYRLVISGDPLPQSSSEMPRLSLDDDAREYRFHGRQGYQYQIQMSDDLIRWKESSGPLLGTGDPLRFFTPASESAHLRVLRTR